MSVIRISDQERERQRGFARDFKALPDRPQTYCIVTYGCQMNARDSETLAGMLEEMGMTKAPRREDADFVLHNTCCIRDNAERKALGNVTWLKEIKKDRPSLLIGVCGCMAQEKGMAEKILRQYPFIDLAFGTGNLYQLAELLFRAADTRRRVVVVPDEQSILCESLPVRRESAYQSYVTIMQGCNNFCSYCIVPFVRGRERSRREDDILREIDALVSQGVKEVTLLGQNVNSYGGDLDDGASFAHLLRRAAETGIPRIRFMTSHPKDLSDDLIDEMSRNPALCRHLHLPVQSGSDGILAAMNRRYTRADYQKKVEKLRAAVPDIGLSTDLIVAFPGESERDFEDTLSLARDVRFDSAFTFIYSPRNGTKAADMPGRVPPDIATERIERLIALQNEITDEIFTSLVGTRERVLVTGTSRRSDRQLTGKSGRNISVNFVGSPEDIGQIVPVVITSAKKNTLIGKKEEEQL